MPLKVYQKTYTLDSVPYEDFLVQDIGDTLYPAKNNIWATLQRLYSSLKRLVATSNAAGLVIPGTFILLGLILIYLQFQPGITQQLKESVGYYSQGTTPLVQESYIADRLQYISNPGADYFQQLTEAAFSQMLYTVDAASQSYRGTMYLSIPSLGFDRLPVKANVNSDNPDFYNDILNTNLAHFKGTSLPAAEAPNNIVIYGHSASGSYNPAPTDVLAAFSFLPNLKVGDIIILEKDGIPYRYQMTRSRIVEPQDTSIITGTPGKETLTLFTCWPAGNHSNRFVATAKPID